MTPPAPKRLLVPIDLSPASRAGLRVGHEIAKRYDAEIVVLHVEMATAALAEVLASADPGSGLEEAQSRHIAGVREKVQHFAEEILGDTVDWRSVVIEGLFPAEAIVHFALERGCDWICLSASGQRGWRHLVLGSTAAQVVRLSPLPVLTLRPRKASEGEMIFDDFHRVLAATDLAADAKRVVGCALGLAAPHGEVTLLHVIESPGELGLYGTPLRFPSEDLEAAAEWSRTALEQMLEAIPGDVGADLRVKIGQPAERILDVERELAPDVLVVGTHRRRGLGRATLGSVAERVVRNATGPVLVLPPEREPEGGTGA